MIVQISAAIPALEAYHDQEVVFCPGWRIGLSEELACVTAPDESLTRRSQNITKLKLTKPSFGKRGVEFMVDSDNY